MDTNEKTQNLQDDPSPDEILTCIVNLPVYKQGDDMRSALETNDSYVPAAFNCLANRYQLAAEICFKLEGLATLIELEVDADCHMIQITGPRFALEPFIESEMLTVVDFEEEDEVVEDAEEEEAEEEVKP
jgi:hypothetical protein